MLLLCYDYVTNILYITILKQYITVFLLYFVFMDFKEAIEIINNKGITAYELNKELGLNEAGIRRVLTYKITNPQRKTKESLIEYAKKIQKTIQNDTNNDSIKNESSLKEEIIELRESNKNLRETNTKLSKSLENLSKTLENLSKKL